ncbi:4Fe-4S dicluster-binding protein [uncultured Desulfovibrio sp.]|uniref:4Fe-4S dicluster-binding protein n=1 Tax=uncultured Desulfovibrio sp. TaxID=167968 RepID=UPI00342CCC46
MPSRRHARVDQKTCVACGTCETVCPRRAALVMHGCWAEIRDDVCVGCGRCAASCPANCIELVERQGRDGQ